MKQLPAEVTIARALNTDTIYIQIRDSDSGTRVLEVALTCEALGKAITGQGCMPGIATWRGLHLVGKKRENKTENCTPDTVDSFEVDGWEARREDLKNQHTRNPDGTHRVVFVRHV